MKKNRLIVFIGMVILSVFSKSLQAQKASFAFFDVLEKRIESKNDTLYVVNFWATWCKPCIEELPYFERCNIDYKNQLVKIILANLDFHSKVETLVNPFLEKKNIISEVVHILDTDPNQWINRVDSTWSGAIPATLFIRNGQKTAFREGDYQLNDLTKTIDQGLLRKK